MATKNSNLQHVHINTDAKVENDGVERLPHERDEAPDSQTITPRKKIQQAHEDLQRGLVDTDMHGERGVEEVVKNQTKK